MNGIPRCSSTSKMLIRSLSARKNVIKNAFSNNRLPRRRRLPMPENPRMTHSPNSVSGSHVLMMKPSSMLVVSTNVNTTSRSGLPVMSWTGINGSNPESIGSGMNSKNPLMLPG